MVFYVAICVFLIVIAGLRYRIGGDTIFYEREFDKIPSLANLGSFHLDSIRWAPGFTLFMMLCKSISTDFTVFQFFHATIINSIIFWFIYKNTPNKFICVCLYAVCLYTDFNNEVLRESMAVCVFLLGWPYFKRGKWLLYYPFAIGACFFHASAIMTLVLPLFAIPGIRGGFRLGYRTIIFCVIIFAVSSYIGKRFFSIIKLLSDNQSINNLADSYEDTRYAGGFNIFGVLEALTKNVLIPAFGIWYYRLTVRMKNDPLQLKYFRKMEIMAVLSIYIAMAAMAISILFRFNNYLNIFVYAMISSCFFQKVQVRRKRYKLGGFSWACILLIILSINFKSYFVNTYGSATNKRYMIYYPYYSRLDPQKDQRREEILRFSVHIK